MTARGWVLMPYDELYKLLRCEVVQSVPASRRDTHAPCAPRFDPGVGARSQGRARHSPCSYLVAQGSGVGCVVDVVSSALLTAPREMRAVYVQWWHLVCGAASVCTREQHNAMNNHQGRAIT